MVNIKEIDGGKRRIFIRKTYDNKFLMTIKILRLRIGRELLEKIGLTGGLEDLVSVEIIFLVLSKRMKLLQNIFFM